MIRLMKSSFYKEDETKERLCSFIKSSKKLSIGDKCFEFEKRFSRYQERKYSVFYNSGSSANLALIQALINKKDLQKKDKIGFSALTWATNVSPLIQLGLTPVPIDISSENLNVNSENLISALENDDLKALFITNLMGFCGDIAKIKKICEEKGIMLLEDNCESLGSTVEGIKLGNFGKAGTFSFFVGHHMSTMEGGMVCTDDKHLYDMLLMVRAHGWSRNLCQEKKEELEKQNSIADFYSNYTFYNLGYNLRPTEINGFIGLEQLKYIEEINNIRNKNFMMFDSLVHSNFDFQNLKLGHMEFVSNFAYPLVSKDKGTMEIYKRRFKDSGVEIRPIVGGSIVEQPFFRDYMKKNGLSYSCPNAKEVHEKGFYFPNNPELDRSEKDIICSLLRRDNDEK